MFKVLPRETCRAALRKITVINLRLPLRAREPRSYANEALRFEGQIPAKAAATVTTLAAAPGPRGFYHIVNYTFANLTTNPQYSLPAI